MSAHGRLNMTTEMTDVGKQCHDSCSTSAATRVRRAIGNKQRQFKRGTATPLGKKGKGKGKVRVRRSVAPSDHGIDRQIDRLIKYAFC